MRTTVWVRTRFVGLHHWPEAPDAVSYLRYPHRHVFHVEAHFAVTDTDREVEFFMAQDAVLGVVEELTDSNDTITWSCEDWAVQILTACRMDARDLGLATVTQVSVSEDNENGATVYAD